MDYLNIIKFLQGGASEKEKEQVLDWIDQSSDNKKEFISIKKAWAFSRTGNENEHTTWNSEILPKIKKVENSRFVISYLKRAAVIILLVGLGGITQYILSNRSEPVYNNNFYVEAPLGQMSNVTLPDGTLVLLNSGSSVSYGSDFSSGNRKVELSGEAFFDVYSDKERPFVVQSELLDIRVYGTTFNVHAYPEDKIFNVTLVEGSIGVLDKNGNEISSLKPGENAFLDEHNSQLVISRVNTEMYVSWREGLISFRDEKLEDVAKKIERWYNVEIEIQNEKLAKERYLGTILKNKPIDQILEVLKLTTSLEYEIITRADKPTLIYWR